jgi:hypothetical protein
MIIQEFIANKKKPKTLVNFQIVLTLRGKK